MNLTQLKTQHETIYGLLDDTKKLVNKNDLENDGKEIAKNISQLAGILKVHLGNEDRVLYPTLKNNEDSKIKNMAQSYIAEMGDLSNQYIQFKDQYNTQTKIVTHMESFKQDFRTVFDAVEKRMKKEDAELYPLAENL